MAPVYGRRRRFPPVGPRRTAQASVGSTSTRSRPAGRSTAARPSDSAAVVVGPHDVAVVAQRRHLEGSSGRQQVRRRTAPPGPFSRASAPNGGRPEVAADRSLGVGQDPGVGLHRRTQRLVVGHPRLDQYPAAAAAG